MEIVLYPDPILRKKAAAIAAFGPDLQKTVREMFEIMYELKGVGLAAPQVGLSMRLLVLNPTGKIEEKGQELALLNPKILSRKGEVYGEEGCLSFPKIYAEIARAQEVTVDYREPTGKEVKAARFTDYVARIVQHENDHLEGILFTDRMSPADKARVRASLKALEERFQEARASRS